MFKAHRWLYHSTLGSRVIKKKKLADKRERFFIERMTSDRKLKASREGSK